MKVLGYTGVIFPEKNTKKSDVQFALTGYNDIFNTLEEAEENYKDSLGNVEVAIYKIYYEKEKVIKT